MLHFTLLNIIFVHSRLTFAPSDRLADILGIKRQVLKGIMAEEAVIRGDFRSTLVFCKEMFEKSPDAGTAQVLKRIAFTMSKYAAENPNEVYKSEANKVSY